MNTSSDADREMVADLNRYRLAAPSPTLKGRVMGAAQEAWAVTNDSEGGGPWRVPVLRLAASAAIAFIVIYSANRIDHFALAGFQPAMDLRNEDQSMVRLDPSFRMSPVLTGLAAVSIPPSGAESAESLRRHGERIRDVLRTMGTEEAAGPESPARIPQSQVHQAGAAPASC